MFLQQIANGLTIGSIWSLVALGYTMVYGIIRLMNFAHGDIYMVGAFFCLTLVNSLRLPVPLALGVSVVGTCVVAVAIAYLGYRPLFDKSKISLWLVAVGASIFLENVAIALWGARTQPFPIHFPDRNIVIGNVTTTLLQIFIIVVALVLMLGLHLFVSQTRPGRAMRAVSQDLAASHLMGIYVERIVYLTFAVGSFLAAIGGILVSMYYNAVYPMMGARACMIAFCAAVVGGVGSIPGAMVGGIVVGLAEAIGAAYVGSGWRDAFAFVVLIIVLLVKPAGLFSKVTMEKV